MLIGLDERDIYREQQSIENSMRDLGSAVGRLDNIFMSLYVIIAAVVLAVVLVCVASCFLFHLYEDRMFESRTPPSQR